MIPARGPQTKVSLDYKYGLLMCVAHMHSSKQQTRSKRSMSTHVAMLCSSGAQCSVAVVTAESDSSCRKVELNAL